MTAFPITITFAALYVIALIPMTAYVGLYRGSLRAARGDGGDRELEKRIRIHGNLIEVAPACILALAAAEGLGAAPLWLWLALACFVLGRISHFLLFDSAKRGFTMLLTLAPFALLGAWSLYKVHLG